MKTVRPLCWLLVLTLLPVGCTDSGTPSAPSASSVSSTGDGGKVTPPPPVKQGKKQIHPGGQGPAAP